MQEALSKLDPIYTDELLFNMYSGKVGDRAVDGKTVDSLWAPLRAQRIGRSELRAYFQIDEMKFAEATSRPSSRRKEKASWQTKKPKPSSLPDWEKVAAERNITLSDRSKRNFAAGTHPLARPLFSKLKPSTIPPNTSTVTLSKYAKYVKALEHDIPLSRSKWTIQHVQTVFSDRKAAFRALKCRSALLGFVGALEGEDWTPSESSEFEEPAGTSARSSSSSSSTKPPATKSDTPSEKQPGTHTGAAQTPPTGLSQEIRQLRSMMQVVFQRLDALDANTAEFCEPDSEAGDDTTSIGSLD